MQAHVTFNATEVTAERSRHELPEYLDLAVALTVTGVYPSEIRVLMDPDKARSLSEGLLAAAQQAERDCETPQKIGGRS